MTNHAKSNSTKSNSTKANSTKAKRTWRRLTVTGVALLAGVTVPSVAVAAEDRDGRARLQRDVDALAATGTTGVLAEVRTPAGRTAARAGVADLESNRPVPWDARHRAGSTTKAFVATTVLQLVGEGRIGLDDTVEQWLPGLLDVGEYDGSKITVQYLLGHRSGLPEYADSVPLERATTYEEFLQERFRTFRPEELVAMALQKEPVFKPDGRQWGYSNTNYVLAGMIIEKATGRSWREEVRDRVIEPLGLRGTILPGASPHLPSPRLAAYKRWTPGGPLTDVSTFAAGQADGSLISTTEDVNRFFRALLGGRLLAPAQLREMQKTVEATGFEMYYKEPMYGLGLMQRTTSCGKKVWFHGGGGWNAMTDNAVTADGRRSVTVFYASALEPDESPLEQAKASAALIDRALCSGRS
ncbi:serine hydrolase domain-containing protein [Spirillospora sp. NPDC052242]